MSKSSEYENNGDRRPTTELSGNRPDGILLCTTPGGQKDIGMRRNLQNSAFYDIPVRTATPSTIPESIYNGQISAEAGMVAAIKVLQLSQKHPQASRALFGKKCGPLLIANDIILQIGCGDKGKWQTFNKPDSNASNEQIKSQLMNMLCSNIRGQTYKEAKFKMGAAAFSPEKQRGIYGQAKIVFLFKPFTEQEIDDYIRSTNHSDLRKTNGSCRWDDEIFLNNIIFIGHIPKSDTEFPKANEFLNDVLSGSLPGIQNLIKQSQEFTMGFSLGDNTGKLNTLTSRILNLKHAGAWDEWRTERLFEHSITQ